MRNTNVEKMGVANDTLKYIEDGYYFNSKGEKVGLDLYGNYCKRNTVHFRPDLVDMEGIVYSSGYTDPYIEVTAEDSISAIIRLSKEVNVNIGCLNFASAKRPGGGFLKGSTAQEEDLCRSSTLYDSISLENVSGFYREDKNDGAYTNSFIFSPKVSIFRQQDEKGNYLFLDTPVHADFVTCAAVNRSIYTGEDHEKLMRLRIYTILNKFRYSNCRALVLGAWGCGVFKNDPTIIATLFQETLKLPRFSEFFTHICFAIYGKSGKVNKNAKAFEKVFFGNETEDKCYEE